MDLWSDDPVERLAAAREPANVGDWPTRIGSRAPMQPWPYGMPTPINPFVIFLGPSPGNSPPPGDVAHKNCGPYELPTAGNAHPGLDVNDGRNYWLRVRELGTAIIRGHAPTISDSEANALIGQLNLGTGQYGEAKNAPFDPRYCSWVPEAIMDDLRPAYVILLGLAARLSKLDSGWFSGVESTGRIPIDHLPSPDTRGHSTGIGFGHERKVTGAQFDLSCGRNTRAGRR